MISVKNLKKFYDNIHNIYILNNLNLIVEDGEFLGIMGASGSGKSTLLRILGGMESFSDGEVKIEGQNLLSMKEQEKELYRQQVISYIFQDYNLLSGLTVKENIFLPCAMINSDETVIEREYTSITKKLEISSYETHFPDEISGGEQQRAAIDRAVMKRSKILLADEPTGSLDVRTAGKVLDLFKQINREYHITIAYHWCQAPLNFREFNPGMINLFQLETYPGEKSNSCDDYGIHEPKRKWRSSNAKLRET